MTFSKVVIEAVKQRLYDGSSVNISKCVMEFLLKVLPPPKKRIRNYYLQLNLKICGVEHFL